MSKFKTIRDELAEKYPAAFAKAKTSRSLAIKLQCYECCGGSRGEAKKCVATSCFLYPFSPAASAASDDEEGEESQKSAAGKARWDALTEEQKAERIAKLKAGRKASTGDDDEQTEDDSDDDDDLPDAG